MSKNANHARTMRWKGEFKMKRMGYVFLIMLICCAFIGCASGGNKALKFENQSSIGQKIKRGVTTQPQIRAMFGDPIRTNFTDSGNIIWHYEFFKTRLKATSYIPVVGLFDSGKKGKKKELVVFFDKKGTVRNYSMSSSDVETFEGLIQ
ncbi:conserved hypothetical protein [Candidatus Desulfarcum epimagneticum]|uniref:Uncharacterized protein n=1 Tax=uncultured Desulfobacteraceae bacterium TaxID=218296 RepID=A0A484HPD5_9BACT|nr:conserved hypothetical protein [uncultured Desulfobacteraceae bacterium]